MTEDRSHDIETDAERERLSALTLPPRIAADLAMRLAEEADGNVKALSDAMLATIRAAGGPPFDLSRATHRKGHLDEIERLFRKPR